MRRESQSRRLGLVLVVAGITAGMLGCPATELKIEDQADGEGDTEWKGVVIEKVDEGSALAKAGLQPGDVVFAWERLPNPPANPEADRGEIETVFDWRWIEVEQAQRGTVKLFEREGPFEVSMGQWGGKVRPHLPNRVLEVYIQGQEKIEAGEIEQGVELWSQLSKLEEATSDRQLCGWIKLRIGEAYAETRAWEQALEAYLAALEEVGTPEVEVAIWGRIGKVYERQSEFDQAEASYQSALKIAEAIWGRSLYTANMKNNLGAVAWYRGQIELASDHWKEALEIRQKLAPDSLVLAWSLNNLGIVAWSRGQLDLASEYLQRDVEITKKLAPDSLDLATSLSNLGAVARNRGQLGLASEYHQRALEIQEKLAPDSLDVAGSLGSLGIVACARGQLDLASEYLQRDVEITKKLAPDSLNVAWGLGSLGNVALARGQLDLANEYYQRALEIEEKLAPDSLDLAGSLSNLGSVALARGQVDSASEYLQRALKIDEKLAPDSIGLAVTLNNLGGVALSRGQLDLASEYFQRALKIDEKLAPNSLGLAKTLNNLGLATRARGDIDRAADFFQHAVHTLEAQISHLGPSRNVQASFRAQYGVFYRNSVETLLQLDRPQDAYATHEGSRARAFLALLTERDLIFSDVPENLDSERRRLAFLYERTQEQFADVNPRDHTEQINQLTSKLHDLRRQYDDNTEKIRRASPKLAELLAPEILDPEGVRQALDPGTVMLSYSVGEEKTDLFVLTRKGPLEVHSLSIGEDILKKQFKDFADLVHAGDWAEIDRSRFELARWLYRKLIKPAATSIEKSDRLLIVPEGPLYRLPFAALIRDGVASEPKDEDERDWHYLVEWKPLHTVLSGTVYAELRKLRRQAAPLSDGESPPIALAAFGDPVYPPSLATGGAGGRGGITDVYVRAATERHNLRPLPHTRIEVETIADLFGPQPIKIYLDKEATEKHAKAVGKDVRIVHFAAHGLLNNDFPLDSALALTIPSKFSEGHENGLLQVWEIFERVRLDADLVVLSACQTATGKEQFGEGLIGLSRAFQYAGARSVLATLWSVEDDTTAELMSRFYRHLHSGKTNDEALRSAQLELIRGAVKTEAGRVASAPYYWAAFQIIGDWK